MLGNLKIPWEGRGRLGNGNLEFTKQKKNRSARNSDEGCLRNRILLAISRPNSCDYVRRVRPFSIISATRSDLLPPRNAHFF